MAFNRKSLAAIVAGSLSVAMLAGCPTTTPTGVNPGTGTGTGGTTTPGTGTGGTTTPGTGTGTDASGVTPTTPATGTASGTTPTASSVAPAPAATIGTTTIRGKVYDADASPMEGVVVRVKSLATANPFERTVSTQAGAFVVNDVPAGVQVEVTAEKEGFTFRKRVEVPLPLTSTETNTYNFGGTGEGANQAFFISKYPEILTVEPADNKYLDNPNKLSYKVTLSEAITTESRNRLRDALRVYPANSQANQNRPASSWRDTENALVDASGTAGVYYTQNGSRFLTSSSVVSEIVVAEDGKSATITFNAPTIRHKDNDAIYQVALMSNGNDSRILDADGNQLGQNLSGGSLTFSSYPAAGNLIINGFKKENLPALSAAANADETLRWAATHDNVQQFKVRKDETAPVLSSVTVTGRNIINLTFSEPLVAFNGDNAGFSYSTTSGSTTNNAIANLYNLDNFIVSVAKTEQDLPKDGDMDQRTDTIASTTSYAGVTLGKAYQLSGALASVEVEPTNPAIVRLVPLTSFRDNKFPTDAKYIKVSVIDNITDIAGNKMSSAVADDIKTGAL